MYLREGKEEEEEKKIELDRSMDGCQLTVDGERDRRLGSQSAEMPAKAKAPPT